MWFVAPLGGEPDTGAERGSTTVWCDSVLGTLLPWEVYATADVYGLYYKVTLVGMPWLLLALVRAERLVNVNAVLTLSYILSGGRGPPLASLLIAWLGAPNVVVIDAFSYTAFGWRRVASTSASRWRASFSLVSRADYAMEKPKTACTGCGVPGANTCTTACHRPTASTPWAE